MKRIALAAFSLLCCLLTETAFSQSGGIPFRSPTSDSVSIVFIKKADSYRYNKIDSATEIIYLVGHVQLQQEKTLIDCDSMVINQKANIIESFGNVHINDNDSVNIYSDYMKYFVDKKMVDFQKKVKLTDGKGVLTTEELHYDMGMRIGTYDNGGKVVNNGSVLTSKEGVYYAETRDVYFKKNVILRDPQYDLATDSLLYNTQTQISTFITWTDIVFRDSTHKSVRTQEGFYDLHNKRAQFGKRPTIIDGSQKITGETIVVNDSTGISIATGNAVYKDTAEGAVIIAGKLESNKKKQTVLATINPLAILKEDQDSIYITGDTLFSGMLSDWERMQSTRPDTAVDKRVSDSMAVKKARDSTLAIANTDTLLEGGHAIVDTAAEKRHNLDLLLANRYKEAESILTTKKGVDSILTTLHVDDSLTVKRGPSRGKASRPLVKKDDDSPRARRRRQAVLIRQAADSTAAAARAQVRQAKRMVDSIAAKKVTDSISARRTADSLVAKKSLDSITAVMALHLSDSLFAVHVADSFFAKRIFDSALKKRPAAASLAIRRSDTVEARRFTDSLMAKRKKDELEALGIGRDSANYIDPADSNKRFLQAYHHVRIFSDSLQAVCDSLWYSGKDSIFRLFTNPVAWGAGDYQVTGDTMFLFTKNKKADRLYVFENALAVNKVEGALYNQLKGITINGYFKNGAVDYMRSKGNAESIYYTRDDSMAFVGVNRSTADIIDMIWQEKKLNRVVLRNDAQGTFSPIRKVNFEDMRLRNFKWLEDIRPKTKYELYEPAVKKARPVSDFDAPVEESGKPAPDSGKPVPDSGTTPPAPGKTAPDPSPGTAPSAPQKH